MKKTGLLLVGLIIAILTNAQTVKIQGGTSLSQLDWQINGTNVGSLYNETLIGYSFFAGVDYLDKKYFNLSSNVGLIRKGGKDEFQLTDQYGDFTGETTIEKATLDYFTINTTIDLKYKIKDSYSPFLSFGPRIDFLINNSSEFDDVKDEDWLETTSYGFSLGGGLNYLVSNILIGIRADYYIELNEVADWTDERPIGGSKITGKTFMINFTLGYKLK